MNKKIIKLLRVTYSELKSSITWGKVVLIIATTFFALLSLFIQNTQNPLTNQVNIIRAVGEGTTYALLIRLINSLRDKSTLDKNRTTYLLFDKKSIAFGKVLGDIILFASQVLLIIVIAPLTIKAKNVPVNPIEISSFIVYFFSISMFFAFAVIGIRFITAALDENKWKWIIVGTWMFFTVGVYLIMSVITALPSLNVGEWFASNQTWIAFIPVFNFVTPSLLLSSVGLHVWVPFILIIETLIISIAVWKPFSTKLKTYLTA